MTSCFGGIWMVMELAPSITPESLDAKYPDTGNMNTKGSNLGNVEVGDSDARICSWGRGVMYVYGTGGSCNVGTVGMVCCLQFVLVVF